MGYPYPKECFSLNINHTQVAKREFERKYDECWNIFYERYPNRREMSLLEKHNALSKIKKELGYSW